MTIVHVVAFTYNNLPEDQLQAFSKGAQDLKDGCKKPDGSNYIQSVKFGDKNNSPEGLGKDVDHLLVMEFANAEDRDFYTSTDPFHQDFVVSRAQASQYTPEHAVTST